MYKGNTKNPELYSGGQAHYSTGFLYLVSFLGTHLYQCTSWYCCERLHLPLVKFFWRLFQRVCPFHDGWFTSAPAHTGLSVQQFLTKKLHDHRDPPSLFTWSLLEWLFLCFPGCKKSTQGNVLPTWNRWNKKMAEALKDIKINEFKNYFSALEKHLNRCIASNGEYFEGDWSLNM